MLVSVCERIFRIQIIIQLVFQLCVGADDSWVDNSSDRIFFFNSIQLFLADSERAINYKTPRVCRVDAYRIIFIHLIAEFIKLEMWHQSPVDRVWWIRELWWIRFSEDIDEFTILWILWDFNILAPNFQ